MNIKCKRLLVSQLLSIQDMHYIFNPLTSAGPAGPARAVPLFGRVHVYIRYSKKITISCPC